MSTSLQLALLDSANTPKGHDLTIREILATAIRCLGKPWQLVESGGTSNLLCIWIETQADLARLKSVEKLCPANRLIVLSATELKSQARWRWIGSSENSYPSVLNLVNLLSRVQASILPQPTMSTAQFDPCQHFTSILQEALADGIARLCSLPEQPAIYLLPNENTVYINGDIEKLIPFALSTPAQIAVKNMSDQELLEQVNYVKFSSRLGNYAAFLEEDLFEATDTTKYNRYCFAESIWFSTLMASQGNLLKGANDHETLFFPKLPDFISTRYPELLADFSELETLTLAERLNAKTEKSDYEQINFYNACLLLPEVQRKTAKQKYSLLDLESTLQQHAEQLTHSTILIVEGEVNAGKSTLCATLTDGSQLPANSTLKFELGEIQIGHSTVFFYQTEKETKIDSSTQVLYNNAWGLLVLIDNSTASPFSELDYYLKLYKTYFNQARIAIGITHCDVAAKPSLADYITYLESLNCDYPVLAVDPHSLSDSIALVIAMLNYQT